MYADEPREEFDLSGKLYGFLSPVTVQFFTLFFTLFFTYNCLLYFYQLQQDQTHTTYQGTVDESNECIVMSVIINQHFYRIPFQKISAMFGLRTSIYLFFEFQYAYSIFILYFIVSIKKINIYIIYMKQKHIIHVSLNKLIHYYNCY